MFKKHVTSLLLFCFSLNAFCVADQAKIDNSILNLTKANNTFAFELLQREGGNGENIGFSPYCISSALAMTFAGAANQTLISMGQVLGFGALGNTLNPSFSWLNHDLTTFPSDLPEDFRLYLGNSLWIQKGQKLLPNFLETMNTYYTAGLRTVDFERQPDAAIAGINSWVNEKTNGKITDLLEVDDSTRFTRMILVSSIYFKSKWALIFNKKLTTQRPFFASQDKTLSVPTMANTAYYPYFEHSDFAMIELPYIHPSQNAQEFSMYILLPKQQQGLAEVESLLRAEAFSAWTSSMQSKDIFLLLPKFKIISSFSLKNTLSEMGMANAFSLQADFSRMTGDKALKIGDVIHKAFIAVDESGTEAAAATAVTMMTTSVMNPSQPLLFKVDHPFVFIITEKMTQAILFMGHVQTPGL